MGGGIRLSTRVQDLRKSPSRCLCLFDYPSTPVFPGEPAPIAEQWSPRQDRMKSRHHALAGLRAGFLLMALWGTRGDGVPRPLCQERVLPPPSPPPPPPSHTHVPHALLSLLSSAGSLGNMHVRGRLPIGAIAPNETKDHRHLRRLQVRRRAGDCLRALGGCLGPWPAPPDPNQKIFPSAKNEIYQRGRKLEVNLILGTQPFFGGGASDPPPPTPREGGFSP